MKSSRGSFRGKVERSSAQVRPNSTMKLVIGMKFGASEAKFQPEYVTKEAPYKDFTQSETKFGRAHNHPRASEAELPLLYVTKAAPAKKSWKVQ
ncbi:hypothetical protein COCNU_scaffold016645G000020 [Cocos nucifera]|nr:hypothetical protein [Cocos nucifera]